MGLQQLPLELLRAILAEAMLTRGLRRALRLRLVNSKWLKVRHWRGLCRMPHNMPYEVS